MHPNLSLTLSDICIERAERLLCQRLNKTLNAGHLYRILGENGAGKTSLLKVIAGLLLPLEGQVTVNVTNLAKGQDQQALLINNSEYIGHRYGVKSHLSVLENIACYCPHAGHEEGQKVLTLLGLASYQDDLVKHLSAGQAKRVALARLWLSNKSIWLLDEPFSSLDKDGVALLEAKFQQHIDSGGLIVLTTHQDLFAIPVQTIELMS